MNRVRMLLCMAGFAAAGCASNKPAVSLLSPLPSTIAILPLNNMSVDMQGPLVVRTLLENYLIASNYDTLDLTLTDEKLKTLGITDGGQLAGLTPQKLGETLNAEGLLYGELIEFKHLNIGIYASRKVEARLWLVEAKTGTKLWEADKKKNNSKVALTGDQAKSQLMGGYAEKALENIRGNPLYAESEDVVRQLVKDLNKTRGGGR